MLPSRPDSTEKPSPQTTSDTQDRDHLLVRGLCSYVRAEFCVGHAEVTMCQREGQEVQPQQWARQAPDAHTSRPVPAGDGAVCWARGG